MAPEIRRIGRKRRNDGGFTLIEVLVALAILGTSLFILLDNHYSSMLLFAQTKETVTLRHLTNRVIGEAEVEVSAGNLTGSGDFGQRFPEYSYSFEAVEPQPENLPRFYEVRVSVQGPSEAKEVSFLLFDGRQV